jgi:hypothetical protein
MSEVIQLSEVPKIDKEKRLNLIYMGWLKHYQNIPDFIISRFKKDVEEIRSENPIYNEKLN